MEDIEAEQEELAWGAYRLAVRMAMEVCGDEIPGPLFTQKMSELLSGVASGGVTLGDPAALARAFPHLADEIAASTSRRMALDREVAQQIVRGAARFGGWGI